jgi:polyphosphate kinase 2
MSKKSGRKQKASAQGKLSRGAYERELYLLQAELVKLQYWVVEHGHRVIIVFEGRDAAGKGGVIKRITERVSPRVFRTEALPAPSDREKGQLYGQRYLSRFPTRGEVVLFDRSWYNRAGVERVMGFATEAQCRRFLETVPTFEKMVTEGGVQLIKYWFDVGMEEQERRFRARVHDPRKTWKLSPMDVESYHRWYQFSRARDAMLEATDTDFAPWHIVRADSKRRARLNCIAHLLSQIPYTPIERDEPRLGKRKVKGKYDDQATLAGRRFVPEAY